MANLNDEKILMLREQIAEKEKKLAKAKRFSPETNCMLDIDGKMTNIQVLNREQLIFLAVRLQSYISSAIGLNYHKELVISGYHIDKWFNDVTAKIDVLSIKEEEAKLKVMKDTLDNLLSAEKKTELQLEAIEAALKG